MSRRHHHGAGGAYCLISTEPLNPRADEFLKQNVFFETKVLAHLDKGVPHGPVQGAGDAGPPAEARRRTNGPVE
jgi:hypothetical protein